MSRAMRQSLRQHGRATKTDVNGKTTTVLFETKWHGHPYAAYGQVRRNDSDKFSWQVGVAKAIDRAITRIEYTIESELGY